MRIESAPHTPQEKELLHDEKEDLATSRMLEVARAAAAESLSGDSEEFLARNRQPGGE